MKTSILTKLALISILQITLLAGCASNSSKKSSGSDANSAKSKSATKQPAIVGDIPRGSPFSKVTIGMPQKQVYDIIGQPNDVGSYVTGKSWIPFYYGPDRSRTEAFYKNQGRIVFHGASAYGGAGSKVFRIIYDPNEDGYNNR